ncbi:MAG: glycosyltransferase family 2 protein, partial [Myxococcales bacterium]|nr:glycosyltransferase family 2 protein [Myxococcales bacterium]
MIVRDEASRLSDAVESARALVDEVVIIDTGSTDGTAELAHRLGARVLLYPWGDDFAAARNASIDASVGDWILALDADERIAPEAFPVIREAVLDEGALGYFMRQRNHFPGGCHAIRTLRLWRRHPEARFRYPIHEQILPSLAERAARDGGRIAELPVAIEHFGYAQSAETTRRKLERNARIMARYLEDRPDDLYMTYV